MRIVVIGAGAVGGYFGGRLAAAGEDVVFIARGEHLQAIRSQGLRVLSTKGDFVIHPANATQNLNDVGTADAVLLAVKAWQVPEVAKSLSEFMALQTFVVPLGNGVEAPSQLQAVLKKEQVLGGLSKIFSKIEAPGKIRHMGVEPQIEFGELTNERTARVEQLRLAFEKAGVSVRVPEDIHVAMWEKFLFIASVSGVGAVTRSPIGVIRSIPETRRMLEAAMREICVVARAKGIPLPDDSVARTMGFVDKMPGISTASMQRDVMEGRPSELSAQNGAVARFGKELGVDTPMHTFIYETLLPMEMKARGEIEFPN
jgi:2-dehydropantoate 2-reductase